MSRAVAREPLKAYGTGRQGVKLEVDLEVEVEVKAEVGR